MAGMGIDAISRRSIEDLLLINRETALLVAQKRAAAVRLPWYREQVFVATFERVLTSTNQRSGLSMLVRQFAPLGYFDPHAELSPSSTK
jgi:hypothetical protein